MQRKASGRYETLKTHLSHREIFEAVETFYRRFYFRPRKLAQTTWGEGLGHDDAVPAGARGVRAVSPCAEHRDVKRLIVTADDFGASVAVNAAIETAHTEGILTTASLMVGGRAASDAVGRARRLPTLKVGLHLVLVRGRTLLPPADVPDLADAYGNLPSDLCRAGVSFFFRPAVRRQLEAEIRAQFAAFGATGLPLDHVNTHHHMHLHPTVCELLLKVGGEYGMAAVRVPNEPWRPRGEGSREGVLRHLAAWVGLRFWVRRLVKRLRQANLQHNDFVFGMRDTGRMSADRVLALLAELPEGVSEMYFHPAVRKSPETPWPKHYACEEELDALTSPVVAAALEASGIRRTSFSELAVAYPVEHGGHGGRRARRG